MTTPARLEKTRPEPMPWTVVAAYSCQVWSWKNAMLRNETPATIRPVPITTRAPTQETSRAVGEPDQEARHRRGEEQEAGLADRRAEAVARLGRGLQQLGDEPERREHRESHRAGDHVGGPHAALPHEVHVDHRHGDPQLGADPRPAGHRGQRRTCRAPAPRSSRARCPSSGPCSRATRKTASRTAGSDREPRGRPDRRLGHHEVRRDRGDEGGDHGQQEQPLVAEAVDDRAGDHDAERRSRRRSATRAR